jgi:hypothetical protein
MSNEGKRFFTQPEEEKKLVGFYKELLNGGPEPSTAYQKKFLLQLINTKIAQVEPKTGRIKNLHYILRISVMVLSALATVFLGLKFVTDPTFFGIRWNADNISNTVLVITATVTLLSGLAVFWDTENYWVRNKIMLNKLKEIRYEYVFFLAGDQKNDNVELKGYLDKFISNLGDEYWEKFLKDVKKNS